MEKRVETTVEDGIAHVRLARPEKRNALDRAMFDAIAGAIASLAAEEDLRCVVLSGEGPAFCAGIDLALLGEAGGELGRLEERTHGEANLFQQVAWGWRRLPVPVIAAVHGSVFGGGCQVMLGADIRLAAPDTQVALMEMRWGIVPDMGAFALLRGQVRDDVVRELVYTARVVDAQEAARLGLVTRVSDDPLAEALALARDIAGRSPVAVRAAKRLLGAMPDESAPALLLAESREQLGVFRAMQESGAAPRP